MGNSAKHTENGTPKVVVIPEQTPWNHQNPIRFFSGYLGRNGVEHSLTSNTNMAVNGSSTPVEFYINSPVEDLYDIYITQILIYLSDKTVQHSDFGGIKNGIVNGFDLKITESNETTILIEKAKTSGELIVKSGFNNVFGSDKASSEIGNWLEKNDVHVINIPVSLWVPGGLRLGRGNADNITAVVNDNLTGLNNFVVRVIGHKNYITWAEEA